MKTYADDLLERLLKSLEDDTVLDPFEDIASHEWPLDPVSRITFEPGERQSVLETPKAFTATELERPSRATYRTPAFKQEQETVAENPELLKTPQFKTQTFNQRRWMKQYSNGQIPFDAMTKIEGGTHFMRPDAGRAYKAMQRAAKKAGINFAVTDSYRSYDAQVDLKKRKPSLAATPGKSNHGWGLALDININDAKVYNWLAKNAKKYGFDQPMSYEPWHWEYKGGYKGVGRHVAKGAKAGGKKVPSAPKGDPLNRVRSVDPLISAQQVFGSILGEVSTPPATKAEAKANQSSGGLGFVPAKFRKLFHEAADRYGLSARLLAMVAKHESAFNPKAVSSAGAQGLMQVMPLHGLNNPFSPRANVNKGAEILASYIERMGSLRGGLAAYNGGPGNPQYDYADRILAELRGAR